MDDLSRKLGLRISYYRRLNGLSQEQLAAKVNCSAGYLAQIEAPNCNKIPSLDLVFIIAEALDITASELLNFPSQRNN